MTGLVLRDYYQQELESLRERAEEFSRDHPAVAHKLALGRTGSRDPHVELLTQSFAFLTGRLRCQMELDQATLPNALMASLYPHLEAPIPSMLVARLQVRPDGANFAAGVALGRGRYFSAAAQDDERRPAKCRLRSAYDTPLWPLEVDDVRLAAITEYDFLARYPMVHSVLRVRVRALGADPIAALPLSSLRFFINSEDKSAYALYDMLALQLEAMAVAVPGQAPRPIEAKKLRWLGFEPEEALLPADRATHPGYRLVQEYFAFPEKFLFFEAGGLDATGAADSFDLLFLLRSAPDRLQQFRRDALQLNCVPLVNLFTQRIDPIALDHSRYEYRVSAEMQSHRHCEIYAIEELSAIRPDAAPREIAPYFALDDFARLESQDYFYQARRALSESRSVPGTETSVSFLDLQFEPSRPADEAIGGRALCTNRQLVEQLRLDARLQLEGPGPVEHATVASKPSAHQTPQLLGKQPWALVSQLTLNHLSIAEGELALSALKSMLRLHVGAASASGVKQIDSIAALECRPVLRRMGADGWRGFVRGLHLRLSINRQRFEGGSPTLFAEVLRRFFALYAAVNTVTEVSLEVNDVKGVLKQWPPMAGAQAVL